MVTDKQGVLGTATLSDADLLEVDALLRSDDLLRAMVQGPFCDPPPTDVSVSFILDAGGPSPLEQDVTGCAFAAAEQEPFARLWNIVRTY